MHLYKWDLSKISLLVCSCFNRSCIMQVSELQVWCYKFYLLYPSGIVLHKHNTDNQAVTYNFNLTFKGGQYSISYYE